MNKIILNEEELKRVNDSAIAYLRGDRCFLCGAKHLPLKKVPEGHSCGRCWHYLKQKSIQYKLNLFA